MRNHELRGRRISKREQWVDILKGFAIICVILGHVIERTIAGLGIQSKLLTDLDFFIYSFHMPLFFLCSGYVYAITTRIEEKKENYIKKKAIDLLIPYTIFAIVVWIGKYIFAEYVTYKVSIKDLFYMYINPIAFLWFIYILFFVSCLIYLLDLVFKQDLRIILFITLILCLSRCFITTDVKIIDRVLFYPFFYVLGILVYQEKRSINVFYVSAICVAFIISLILHFRFKESMIITITVNAFGSLFFATLFHLLFSGVENSTAVGYLGQKSIYLYVLHPIVVNAVRAMLRLIGFRSVFSWFVLLTISGIMIPVLYEKLFNSNVFLDFLFRPSFWIRRLEQKRLSK